MSALTEIIERLDLMPAAERQQVTDLALQTTKNVIWIPSPGPQTDAYFSLADELLYGGAAGGGKTDLVIGLALGPHERSVIYREELKESRAIGDRLTEIVGTAAGYNSQLGRMKWRGRLIEFGALGRPGDERKWQGIPHDFIGFDEAANIARDKIEFVSGWARSTTPGQRCRIVYASNPPLDATGRYLITWFAPWLDPTFPEPAGPGELRYFVNGADGDPVWVNGPGERNRGDGTISTARSRTFIPALLDDNPFLGSNYRAQLEARPEPYRTALLTGNFAAGREDDAWQVIPTAWVKAAMDRWKPQHRSPMLVMAADIAQGGTDSTCLAMLHAGNWFAPILRWPGAETPDGPSIGARIVQNIRDQALIAVDGTGGWGGGVIEHLRQAGIRCAVVIASAASGAVAKTTNIQYLNTRAEMWWKFRDALEPRGGEMIMLPPDDALLAELTAPAWKLKGGKIQVESKDDIRARIARSTDRADAVLMAWHLRHHGAARILKRRALRLMQPDFNPLAEI